MAGRKVNNPLALAVLATIRERPRHPYEIAQVLRSRHKEHSIRINYGSLYTVVQNLERHGFIEASATERSGRRPQRTLYSVTETGAVELREWLAELLGTPVKEYPQFESALSLMGVLPPDEVVVLLEQRVAALDSDIERVRDELAGTGRFLPRLFLVESEYSLAMMNAELEWTERLIKEMTEGTLGGVDGWREYHATGRPPEEWVRLEAETPWDQEEPDGPDSGGEPQIQ